jgi:hypothetical protein
MIVTTINNVKRWVKTRGYLIHDNGARTLFVHIKDNNTVSIRKLNIDGSKYDSIVKSYTVKKIIVGKSTYDPSKKKQTILKYLDGNSILLQLINNKYVFIGNCIYEFTMPDDYKKYYSLVGNSDVPYPVLVGSEYIYFMLDGVYIPKEMVIVSNNNYEDSYEYFYKNDLIKKSSKIKNLKLIYVRN